MSEYNAHRHLANSAPTKQEKLRAANHKHLRDKELARKDRSAYALNIVRRILTYVAIAIVTITIYRNFGG